MISRPKSSRPIKRSLSEIRLEKNYSSNNILNHSPKISNGKFRFIMPEPKLFSILDVNEKVTNSKGPSIPLQYKRYTSKEIKQLFNKGNTETHKLTKKFQFNSMKNILLEKMKPPCTPPLFQKIKKNFKEKFAKKCHEIEKTQDDIKTDANNNNKIYKLKIKNKCNTSTGKEIKKIKKENTIKQRPQTCKSNRQKIKKIFGFEEEEKKEIENEIEKERVKTSIKRDMWKPINYEAYENIYKNRKMQENPFFVKLPQCSLKEIKEKMNKSDVFFLNNIEISDLEKLRKEVRTEKYNIYFDSDIFNIKNDDISIKKIGEKYLFNDPKIIKYTSSRESKSAWANDISNKHSNNFSSKKYNILSPNRKNDSLTKDDIYKILNESSTLNNPLHRQKGISKYLDLANNCASNLGQEYSKIYNSNPNCFKMIPEYCSSFGDLYLQYKNLCDQPFCKKKKYKQE